MKPSHIAACFVLVVACGSPTESIDKARAEPAIECDPTECDGTGRRCIATRRDLILPEAGCYHPDPSDIGCWEAATCEVGEFYGVDSDALMYRVRGCTNADSLHVRSLDEVPPPEDAALEKDCAVVEAELAPFCTQFEADDCPLDQGCGLRVRLAGEVDPETGCEVVQNRHFCEVVLPGDNRGQIVLPAEWITCPPGVDDPQECLELCGSP